MKKKILVIYTSAGYGHKKIGENLAEVLKEDYEVDLVDLFAVAGGRTASWGTKIYLSILEFVPGLWVFLYTNKFFISLTLPLRTKLAKYKAIPVANILLNKKYDIVLTTQVTASAVVSYLKKEGLFKGKFVVTFSDFHLHRYWLFDNVDLYLANIQEQKDEMVKLGIPAEKISVCGVTVPWAPAVDKEEVRKEFGLTGNEKVILFLGGGRGLGINTDIVSELLRANARLFVICGHNTEMRNKLEKFYANRSNLLVLGFVEYLPKLYAIADIVVTKPGGLTITEVLRQRVPIIISAFIPGQERLNYDYLAERNLVMPEIVDLLGPVEDELKTGLFAQNLLNNPNVEKIVQHGEIVKEAINKL